MADAFGVIVVHRCGAWRDQPAGVGGTRQRAIGLAEQQTHDTVGGGAEREAAARGQVKLARIAAQFGKHGGQAATAQSLLEYPQSILWLRHPHDDQPRGIQSEGGKADAIGQPCFVGGGGFRDPQNRAIVLRGERSEDCGGEAGHRCGIAALVAAHFVERVASDTAGEQLIELWDREGDWLAIAARG